MAGQDPTATGPSNTFAGSGGQPGSGGSAGAGVAGGFGLAGTSTGGSTAGAAGDGGAAGSEICKGDPYEAKLLPLDMFIMMDRSGSMEGGNWNSVRQAVNDFVAQPVEGHVGVGLGLFPSAYASASCNNDNQCGAFGPCKDVFIFIKECAKDDCYAAGYASPVVPIQPLPAGAAPLQNQLNSTSPGGGTPMAPALQGAIQYAQANVTAHPTHITTVVLVSDGFPEGCGGSDDISVVASAAAAGLNSGIRTFVVGIGSELSNFEQIATSGGTSPALIIDGSSDISQEFQAKLEEIRGSVQCTFTVPEPPEGQVADYGTLNVLFTPEGGDPDNPEAFPWVASEAECGDEPGHYLDDNANPTTIFLCPASCERIKNTKGVVNVELGCEKIVRDPY